MLKLILLLIIPGILWSDNLNEKLQPVSENQNKYYVKTKNDLKKEYSQDKHLTLETSKMDRKKLRERIKIESSSKPDRNNLISDFKKECEKKSEIKNDTKKKEEKKEEKSRREAKYRRK
jgi:hypothetical protein